MRKLDEIKVELDNLLMGMRRLSEIQELFPHNPNIEDAISAMTTYFIRRHNEIGIELRGEK